MSNLPEAMENFADGAISNLNTANKVLKAGLDDDAFIRSFWWCENVLKAVLMKAIYFDSRNRASNKYHDYWELYQKIKSLNIIDVKKILKIEQTLQNLLTINISSGSEHVNSPHTRRSRVGDLRYIDLTKFFFLYDTHDKGDQADWLVSLLSGYF